MRKLTGVILGFVICCTVPVANAALVPLDISSGYESYSLSDYMETSLVGNIAGVVIKSGAFTDGSDYLYLYQIVNDSPSTLHRMTVSPFGGLSAAAQMGYITGGEPVGFGAGGSQPTSGDEYNLTGGFNFDVAAGAGISTGQYSAVLYIQSSLEPGQISGQVINSGVAYGAVTGAVPEPATVALLGLGGAGAVLFGRRRG